MMRVILASKSPRRIALMQLAGIECEVIPSSYDEKLDEVDDFDEMSKELAYKKALSVFNHTQGDRIIIGADTLVIKDDKIYGKPKDRDEAIEMLQDLEDDIHEVYTGLSIIIEEQGKVKEIKEVIKTEVTVNEMSNEEIISYVDQEEPYDKAGAYAIQSSFAKFISSVDGNYMSVIGLPIDRVYELLKENGAFN